MFFSLALGPEIICRVRFIDGDVYGKSGKMSLKKICWTKVWAVLNAVDMLLLEM